MYGDQTATLLEMLGITDDSEMGKNILNEKVEDLVNISDHQPKQKKNKKNKKSKK